jgi:spermidine synthase
MAWKETLLYFKQSPYQRIAFFTEADGSYSLTLDDFWQFNSNVEHIYHECLFTMPGMFPKKLENVLVLGGGDGLGARELLKFPSIKTIEVVDLDPEIVKFAKENIFMKNLNKDSFNNSKVKITTTDAKKWLAQTTPQKYDLIIIDFPDPTSDELWDLYTVKLYKQVAARLDIQGTVAIQSSTYNTKAFELIFDRLDKVFPYILGYHTGASSVFCGFFLCSFVPIKINRRIPEKCRWLDEKLINRLMGLPLSRMGQTPMPLKAGPGNLGNIIASASRRSRRRPGNLAGYMGLGSFGKGAMMPPPEAPAPVDLAPVGIKSTSAVVTGVVEEVGTTKVASAQDQPPQAEPVEMAEPAEPTPEDSVDAKAEMAITSAKSGSALLSNPLVIVGLGVLLAIPLIIRIIRK